MNRKTKTKSKGLFYNDKIVLLISFLSAIVVWVMVAVFASPPTTRVIQGVKVVIDENVPSQFGLEVFGESEFTVDVTVKGKKYLISSASLTADDIIVTAQTNNVDSAGKRTLTLKAESASGSADYTISSISSKTVDVYFDTAKTVEMVIKPLVVADGFNVVADGFTSGDINLSETAVTITGPSTEINRIESVVAKLVLDAPLSSNKSADAAIVPLSDDGKSNFQYLTMSIDKVVLTIPVLQQKELKTIVTFKNAPDNYVVTPLDYNVSPRKDYFNISVDEYDKTTDFSVGTIDFKTLSPSNHVFSFDTKTLALSNDSSTDAFTVDVDMSGITQEYITYSSKKIKVNNPKKITYNVSGLNKSVVVVGTEKDLESITEDDIRVEIDLSELEIRKGQSVTVPAVVSVKSASCWVYGTYSVEVSL